MMLTRAYDDRMYRAQRQGKTSFYMKCTGEEAIGVAQAMALAPDDMAVPDLSPAGAVDRARLSAPRHDVPVLFERARPAEGPPAAGALFGARRIRFSRSPAISAPSSRRRSAGRWPRPTRAITRIAAGWIGEGATAEPDFHHALTFAAVYRAPVVLNVVNNQWAISSHQEVAGGDEATFAARAIGFGLACLRVDGNDFLAVYAATQWAAERARANHGATLIELFTYRAGSHSTSDDPTRYRPEDEPRTWPLGDPVERLSSNI